MKKLIVPFLTIGFLFPLLTNNVFAEGRYSFEKNENTILRFDNQTGQIDKCVVEKEGVQCLLSTDDRVLLETEIAALKQRIAELELNKSKQSLSSKEEIDQAFDMMKYFVDKFQKMVNEEETVTPQKL